MARENLKEYINTFFSGKKEQTPRQATCKDKPGTKKTSTTWLGATPSKLRLNEMGPLAYDRGSIVAEWKERYRDPFWLAKLLHSMTMESLTSENNVFVK